MSPLRVTKDVRMAPRRCGYRLHAFFSVPTVCRRFSQIFDDVLSTEFQLFEAHPKNTLSVLLNFEDVPDLLCFVLLQPKLFPCVFSCMASAFLARGTATISGILDNICRLESSNPLTIKYIMWTLTAQNQAQVEVIKLQPGMRPPDNDITIG
eukprot:GHVQ01035313.1.p2 GENE.GHVQ01035313.1~~GHVQ01035313.1.p2  ORF type:complete len:152 (-),score=6.75 GHVQ01035313.1:2496-2951(-)